MNPRIGNCPLENQVASALESAGIEYRTDYEGRVPEHLDFYLPKQDVHIEVKGGHSGRIANQMKRSRNVIVIQGEKAVALFCSALANVQSEPRSQRNNP